MTAPDWWWSGLAAQFACFVGLMLLLTWALFRWGQRQVDKLDVDLKALDESQRAFQQDMRDRLWDEEAGDGSEQ